MNSSSIFGYDLSRNGSVGEKCDMSGSLTLKQASNKPSVYFISII